MHESADGLLQACAVHKVCKTISLLDLKKKLINFVFFGLADILDQKNTR